MGEKPTYAAVVISPIASQKELSETDKRLKKMDGQITSETTFDDLRKLVDIQTPTITTKNDRNKDAFFILFQKTTPNKFKIDGQFYPEWTPLARQIVRDKNDVMTHLEERDYTPDIIEAILRQGYASGSYCAAQYIADVLNAEALSYINTLPQNEADAKVKELHAYLRDKILDNKAIKGATPKRFFMLLDKRIANIVSKWKQPEQPAKIQNAVISATQNTLIQKRDFPETDTTAATLDALKAGLQGEEQKLNPAFFGLTLTGIETAVLISIGAMLVNKPEYAEVDRAKKDRSANITLPPSALAEYMGLAPIEHNIKKLREAIGKIAKMTMVADGDKYRVVGSPFIFQEKKTQKEGTAKREWTFTLIPSVYVLPGSEKSADYIKLMPQITRYIFSHAPTVDTGEKAVNVAVMIACDIARRKLTEIPLELFGYKRKERRDAEWRQKQNVLSLAVEALKNAGVEISVNKQNEVTAYSQNTLNEIAAKVEKRKAQNKPKNA